jgi:hypothetical protein
MGNEMLSFGFGVLIALVGLAVFERLVAWVLPYLVPVLPNDYCGPDGWFMDTKAQSGVFDR